MCCQNVLHGKDITSSSVCRCLLLILLNDPYLLGRTKRRGKKGSRTKLRAKQWHTEEKKKKEKKRIHYTLEVTRGELSKANKNKDMEGIGLGIGIGTRNGWGCNQERGENWIILLFTCRVPPFLFQVNVERVQRTHTESHSMEEEKKRKVMREKRVLGRQSIGYS